MMRIKLIIQVKKIGEQMAKVRFVGKGLNKVINIAVGTLILEGAEEQGVELVHGCRYGACQSCFVEVLEGLENIDSPNIKIFNGVKNVQTCISKIKKDGYIIIKVN